MAFEKNPDEIGQLWLKTGQKGDYMTGEVNGVKVVCFHTNSENPKAPKWRVLRSKPREDRDELPVAAGPPSQVADDDIPW